MGTLSEEVLGDVVGPITTLQLWKTLANRFKQSFVACEFCSSCTTTTRLKEPTLPIHLCNFKSICDLLHTISKPVSDTNKVFQLLEGLDDSYEIFRTFMLDHLFHLMLKLSYSCQIMNSIA